MARSSGLARFLPRALRAGPGGKTRRLYFTVFAHERNYFEPEYRKLRENMRNSLDARSQHCSSLFSFSGGLGPCFLSDCTAKNVPLPRRNAADTSVPLNPPGESVQGAMSDCTHFIEELTCSRLLVNWLVLSGRSFDTWFTQGAHQPVPGTNRKK